MYLMFLYLCHSVEQNTSFQPDGILLGLKAGAVAMIKIIRRDRI